MKKRIILTWILGLLFSGSILAQGQSVYQKNGLAINGYDPVSYFTENKPVEGKDTFSFTWRDARWLFSSQSNLESFKTNPEKYAPQYGGFCAFGVSEDHKSPTDPSAWTIVEGKLYLNYSRKVKELWSKDIPARISRADELWPSLNKPDNKNEK